MRLILSFVLLFSILNPLLAQEDDGFNEFFSEFKAAIKSKDKNKVAELSMFPLYSFDFVSYAGLPAGGSELDQESFLKQYKKIFTSQRVKTLLSREPTKTDLYGDESECYTWVFESKQTFSCWLVFSKSDTGVWKLVSTDNVNFGD
jgi:hypothetical protein